MRKNSFDKENSKKWDSDIRYSERDMEQILENEFEVPEYVNERIGDAYRSLGIEKTDKVKYKRKHRVWTVVAAAAALVAGISVAGFAANKMLSAYVSDDGDTVRYNLEIDREKPAHKIEVETTYMPEGYEYGDENSSDGGKWHNYDTDGGITIIPMNAAELDKMERLGDGDFMMYAKDEYQEEVNLNGKKMGVFVSDDFYVDSADTIKSIFLFNEEDGYAVQIWSKSNLAAEELMKVAEGLRVTVMDETVAYATEEEIEEELQARGSLAKSEELEKVGGVSADDVYEIGDEIADPFVKGKVPGSWDDIRFTVLSAEIKDAISLEEYPVENFTDYENDVAPWMNEDGTLKPHERYRYKGNRDSDEGILETVDSKYVVVRMKAENCGDTQSEWNQTDGISIAPDLTVLEQGEGGIHQFPSETFGSANENYYLQWGGGDFSTLPIYFDKMFYTDGKYRLKHSLFRPLAAGEELEYTLIYVVDEDQIDNLYLWFFSGTGGTYSDGSMITTPYVKID